MRIYQKSAPLVFLMLKDYALGKLQYKPSNSLELSLMQYQSMETYKSALYMRILKSIGYDADTILDEYVSKHKDKYPHL